MNKFLWHLKLIPRAIFWYGIGFFLLAAFFFTVFTGLLVLAIGYPIDKYFIKPIKERVYGKGCY